MGRALITYCIDKVRSMLPAFMRKWRLELWVVPLFITLFLVVAKVIRWYDPAAGPYDPGNLHVLFFAALKLFCASLFGWILLRAYFREVWDYTEGKEFEQDFNMLGQKWRVLITLIIFFGFLFAFVALAKAEDQSKCIVSVAQSQVGVHEATGHNDGKQVETYLASVKLSKGNAWCAAFVAWTYDQCNVVHPVSGWTPSWFTDKSKLTYHRARDGIGLKADPEQLPGSIFGIYFPSKKRVAHVGIIEKVEGSYILTIEGNTNPGGSRDGDGVYKRRRSISQVYCIATYHKIRSVKGRLKQS